MNRLGSLIISLLISFFLPIFIWGDSQSLPTNRVYYVDNSYSMKTNGLWYVVKSNLKNAISNVFNDNDLITVAFFSDKTKGLPFKTATANKKGILEIHQFIDSQKETVEPTLNTHHYIAFSDFINNRVKPGYVNIMFILTDGGDEYFKDGIHSGNSVISNEWNKLFSPNTPVFGFYVDLNKSRFRTAQKIDFKGKELPWTMFENGASNHLYIVEGADLDINLIRFDNNTQDIDIRKTSKLKIKYSGEIKSKEDLEFSFSQKNKDFDVSIESIERDYIVLRLSSRNVNQALPDKSEIKLRFSLKRINGKATNDIGKKRKSFLASDREEDFVTVHFIDEKNRFASIKTVGSNNIDIEHYNSFLFSKKETDTIIRSIKVVFSKEAKNSNCSINLKFAKSGNKACILDESNNPIEEIVLSPDKTDVTFKFTSSNNNRYPFEDNVKIELTKFSGLDYITIGNDTIKSNSDAATVCAYQVRASEKTNPLIWWFLVLISLPFILFALLKLYEWIVRNSKPKFPGGKTTLQFNTPTKESSIINFSLLACGDHSKKLGVIPNNNQYDKGSSLNINKLHNECVEKLILLDSKTSLPEDIKPHRCNGWILYIKIDFKEYTLANSLIEIFEIVPLRNKRINIKIYSKNILLKNLILDAKKINNPQSEIVSDYKHTISVDPKKAKLNE